MKIGNEKTFRKMTQADAEELVDVRDIFARIHDGHVGSRNPGLSSTELAAIRDCLRRINRLLVRDPDGDA